MITLMQVYRVNQPYVAEFEREYAATGEFGGMFVRHGCGSYALLRDKDEPRRYLVVHTWPDEEAFGRAQQSAAQESYLFQHRSRGWIRAVDDPDPAESSMIPGKPNDRYEVLSEV